MDYSRIVGEAPMDMVKPPEMVFRWDLWFWNLRRLELCFGGSPEGFGILDDLLSWEAVEEASEGPTTP